MGLITLLVFSCKSPLTVGTASYKVVRPGHQGQEMFTEFILVFNKAKHDSIHVTKAIVYGYDGYDYHYDDIVLNDEELRRTLKNSVDQTTFSVYLNTSKAIKKEVSDSEKLTVEVFYDVNGKNQKLMVDEFNNEGVKMLRN